MGQYWLDLRVRRDDGFEHDKVRPTWRYRDG